MTAVDELLALAGPEPGAGLVELPSQESEVEVDLAAMLSRVNGVYAFESALHVLPSDDSADEIGLRRWNREDLWREQYGPLAVGHLFFAEDAFGVQFSIRDGHVFTFDPETGTAEPMASGLEEWADLLLRDHESLTGFPLMHEWQRRHGRLPPGKRLIPKQPFVLGGEYAIENLYSLDSVEAMRFRAEIARQIEDLPEGAAVTLGVVE